MYYRKQRERRKENSDFLFTSARQQTVKNTCICIVHQCSLSLRKEVIQPHLPVRLPCYDFTPLTKRTFGMVLLAVRLTTSGTPHSDGVTGGVYKARERIHRTVLMCDY